MQRPLSPTPPAPHGRTLVRAVIAGAAATAVLALAPSASAADHSTDHSTGQAPHLTASAADRDAAQRAVTSPATLHTLARFFAESPGARPQSAAAAAATPAPRIKGQAVPVYTLSPDFVAARTGAPVARLDFLAGTAVSADGRKASVWTAPEGRSWQVVNIATGDDETRYAGQGAAKLPGGTVFREPQINAWYVTKGTRVLPLDSEAVRAVGAGGTTLAAYQHRVHQAYGDKLPGSAYAKKGEAGGYAESTGTHPTAPHTTTAARSATAAPDSSGTALLAGGAGALVLGLGALFVRRTARHSGRPTTISSSCSPASPGAGTE
ncbi:hypothetical protein G3I19_23560 [Streptomyces sp. SID10853]|uniref:hypothetical protein n=1 Tax=Streptomyces sp. SID10853 TaxID=2706028 RepID=UPI0013BEEADA|nr:hypothetical protein [Streptomyces sp. SID10853]NDZ81452.1 hypothetical protein [Streptomyces sp. SID10853]